jgi:cobalt/nickel transport protein
MSSNISITMKMIQMLLILGILMPLASGHALYAEFSEDLKPNSQAELWIAYGHGGSADLNLSSLPMIRLISPEGQESDLNLEPYQGGLKINASLKAVGCYILDMKMNTSLFNPSWFGSSGSTSLVEKYGRALLPVQSGEGFDWSNGRGLEIVAESDPYGLKSGQEFKARAMWNGKAVPGSFSAVVTRTPEDVLMIQHAQETEIEGNSSDGSLSFAATRPGLWVLSFEATIDESGKWKAEMDDADGKYKKGDELEYEQIAPTAYMTFWVEK